MAVAATVGQGMDEGKQGEGDRPRMPTAVVAARAGFALNGAAWIVLGVASLARMAGGTAGQPVMLAVLGALMLGNAAVLLWIGRGLGRQRRIFLYLGLAVLAANLVLTVTDQMGLYDWLILALNLGLLVLLLASRTHYGSREARE